MRWLRKFFYDEDPIVKVAAGLSEPEALMYKELLENNAVPAMPKNRNFLSVTHEFGSFPGDFDLYVRRSDWRRAHQLLKPIVRAANLVVADAGDADDDAG
jgi:hypothetical protein